MRSLKDFNSKVGIFDLIPGEYYVIDFFERINDRYYLFQFDSLERNYNNDITVCNIGYVLSDSGGVYHRSTRGNFFSVPNSEKF